jgi:hypothetical protein
MQLPIPSQLAASEKVLPVQLAWRHPVAVDHGRHAPRPLQVPSLEQFPRVGSLARQRCFGSAPPSGTAEHVPSFPETLQLEHSAPVEASLHAELQHTPSVHKLLAHCLPVVQLAPFGFRPHELLTQVLGGAQSLSRLQVDGQAELLHTKVPHDTSTAGTQAPDPSHVEAGVSDELPEHTAALHERPFAVKAQAPAAQVPVVPQVD